MEARDEEAREVEAEGARKEGPRRGGEIEGGYTDSERGELVFSGLLCEFSGLSTS